MLDDAGRDELRARFAGAGAKRRRLSLADAHTASAAVQTSAETAAPSPAVSPDAHLDTRAPAFSAWQRGRDFAIVVDAGSSGSRVQVYSWQQHDIARQARLEAGKSLAHLPRVEVGVESGDGWHLKTTPGISTFGPDPAGVDAHLKPLLDHALSVIPAYKVASTPFFLLATAGMRLLPDDQREAVLERACRYVSENYAFSMPSGCSEHIRVITGEEEGTYGWVAVNYLLDGFDAHDTAHHDDGREGSSTFGFLDMGGASTQIAFEPAPAERTKHANDLVDIHLRLLDGRDIAHPIFVTTWLGYGTNRARERYIDALVESAPVGAVRVEDPCTPRDLAVTDERHAGITIAGTGDFAGCLLGSAPLLNKNAPCSDEPCLFDGKHVPSIDFAVNRFVGVSEYWYSTHELWDLGGVYDFVAFEKRAKLFCGRAWNDILADVRWHATEASTRSRLEAQCFKAAWIVNILHEGIGLPRLGLDPGGHGDGQGAANLTDAMIKAGQKGLSDAPPSFQSLDQVGDVAVSWTLGKIVLEVAQSVPPAVEASGGRLGYFPAGLGHHPAWGGVGASVGRAAESVNPMIVLGLAALALFGCLFRRRGFNPFRPSWYGRKRGDGTPTVADYQLVGMEEGGEGGSRSVSPSTSPPTLLSRLPLPAALKRGLKLTARSMRPAPSSLLPVHATRPGWGRASSFGSGLGQPPMLRHTASSPNLTRHASSSFPQTKFDARVVSSSSLRLNGTRTPPLGPQSNAWRRPMMAGSDVSDDGFPSSTLQTPDVGEREAFYRPSSALSRTSSFTSLTALRGRGGKDGGGSSALAMEA